MRLKGGADDMIRYYNFDENKWANGNTEDEYDVSIKYNVDTEDIAIEVEEVISELIKKGVMDEGKIERINIDVTKGAEHKIGRNYKIYWSQNNEMITVGYEYDGDSVVYKINKYVREGNDIMKEANSNMFYLRPSSNANTNTNNMNYGPNTEAMKQVYEQAYTDMKDDYEKFDKQFNQMTEQAYMDIAAVFEAAKNKPFNEENEVAKKIELEFGDYLYAYQRNESNFPITTFEKYIEMFSTADKEKILDYLKKNPNYFDMLIDDHKEVQWQIDSNGDHRLIATKNIFNVDDSELPDLI